MNINYKIGKLERGLDMASELQNRILFKNFDLEKGLHVFLTVSESLQRKDDINWVKGELGGWSENKIPPYRKILSHVMHNESFIKFNDGQLFTNYAIPLSYPKLKHDAESISNGKNVVYSLDNAIQKDLSTISSTQLNDNSKLTINPSDLYELFSHIKLEMLKRLNNIINEIIYDILPRDIFQEFQNSVHTKLKTLDPKVTHALNIAIENLGDSENHEKTSVVAHECRRLIKIVADELCEAGSDYKMKDDTVLKIGPENTINRLRAYVDQKDKKIRKPLLKKLDLLHELYSSNNDAETMSSGVHGDISNTTAKMLVIYNYLILGDIIRTKNE